MPYVDGFVLPVPKRKLAAYRRLARQAAQVWREHGALEYRECVGDDLTVQGGMAGFPQSVKARADETIVLAWIVYKSRAHRDRVNAKVMADPRMTAPRAMPFDVKRMVYGGFKVFVDR